MEKYKKSQPKLIVKYIDSDTDEVLFEITDRNSMNIGELLTEYYVDNIVKEELKKKNMTPPENIMVLVVGEYSLV